MRGSVADGLNLLTFVYLDDTLPNNTVIPTPVAVASLGNIRRITIALVTNETTVGVQETFPLVVDVRLRN